MSKTLIKGKIDITIEEFNEHYIDKIDELIDEGNEFVIGDQHGFDHLLQTYLHCKRVKDITIFHTGNNPELILSAFNTFGGYQSYEEADKAMKVYSENNVFI